MVATVEVRLVKNLPHTLAVDLDWREAIPLDYIKRYSS